ncbi:MAG: methionyl-tRNA formyltransferase, partial [Opitutaceae bacterium]
MNGKPLRMAFLGSDALALPLLDWLSSEARRWADVVAVFTQPDRAAGRGRAVVPNAIKRWALAKGLPVLQPERLRDAERLALAGFEPDLALVMAYGHILKDEFIRTPRLGTVNLHASLLPRYRGASPIQAAVASGERETGVSLMRIVRELDAGPVADAERIPIGTLDTAADVEGRIAEGCPRLLARALPKLVSGELVFAEQDGARASFCRKLNKEDGVLDFSAPAAVLAARVNGLHPWPGCAVEMAGLPIKLGLADAVGEPEMGEPGAVRAGSLEERGREPGAVVGAD